MKNVFIPQKLIDEANSYDASVNAPLVLGLDEQYIKAFVQLNPLLSNGHRSNPITQLIDPSVPQDVKAVLSQFVQKVGSVQQLQNMSDEELLATLPSRYFQSEPQLEQVREALLQYAEEHGIGVDQKEAVSKSVEQSSEPVVPVDNSSNSD